MKYVVSRLSAGVEYTLYEEIAGGKQVATGSIFVMGGAKVANKKTLVTPQGVVTPVSDAQAEQLKRHPLFKIHEANGNVKILEKDPVDADNAATDLDGDKGAQLTPEDYKKTGKKTPKTGKDK